MSSPSSNPPVDLEKGVAGPAATANQFPVNVSMSAASSDLPLDLEKGAAWPAATKEEELAVLNPRVVKYIIALDVIIVMYLLFSIGLIAWTTKVSNNPWDAWPVFIIVWLVWMLLLCVHLQLAKLAKKRTLGSDDGDLSTKLLAS